jgi:glutamate racemase
MAKRIKENMKDLRKSALGVFDSGLGGLTVVRELLRQMPDEDIVYFGDTARVPYGTKSPEAIINFSKENVRFLIEHKVKIIVVACNSSSSFAISQLKKEFSLPVIGVIKPGARKAVLTTKSKKIGIIATSATIQSGRYAAMIKKIDSRIKVISQPCPLFVPLVEEGWFDRQATYDIAEVYLKKLRKQGVDVVVLGCTHYPILKTVIQEIMGPKVTLIDSAQEVACEIKNVLEERDLQRSERRRGKCQIFVSDKPQHFKRLAYQFLNRHIGHIRKVSLCSF